jgi:hypothetical protein
MLANDPTTVPGLDLLLKNNLNIWWDVDADGNSLLHLAAIGFNASGMSWLLDNFGETLSKFLNNVGATPLDVLQQALEHSRSHLRINQGLVSYMPLSDLFSGYSDEQVQCLAVMQKYLSPSGLPLTADGLQKLKFGCTCGTCLEGILSPRMVFALVLAAKDLAGGLENDDDDFWRSLSEPRNSQIPEVAACTERLRTDPAYRTVIVRLCRQFAPCISRMTLPTPANIRAASGDPSVSQQALDDAAMLVLSTAMDHDMFTGDASTSLLPGFQELAKRRNDHEYGFVSRLCGYLLVAPILRRGFYTGKRMHFLEDDSSPVTRCYIPYRLKHGVLNHEDIHPNLLRKPSLPLTPTSYVDLAATP